MSLLARAIPARPTKAIDQEAQAQGLATHYIPIENLQRWTGLGVAPETALNIITVYQCVRVLAETFAQLPLMVYRRLPNGGKERATDHPLYQTLHSQPNPDMTSFVWRELLMTHLATWGNAYCEKVTDPFGRLQLWPIRPDRIEPHYDSQGRKVYDYLSPLGARTTLKPGSVFHIQGMSSNGLVGFSPITVMRNAIRLYRTAEQFGTSFFDNNARPATVLSHPKLLSENAIKRLAGQMDELRGSRNAGKTVILEEGLQLTEVGIPPEDAQFMETRLFQKREIAGAYRIQPHKVGDLERATFSNIEHQSLEFIQDTMMPWFVRTEQEINVQLVDEEDVFAEFLVDGYLRGDAKTRNEAYALRWQHGNLNADEWRIKENENPIPDGSGSLYYVPVNYQPAISPQEEPVAEPEPEADMTPEGMPPEGMPPLVAVKSAAAFRCPDCNAKLAENEVVGMRVRCGRCKVIREVAA